MSHPFPSKHRLGVAALVLLSAAVFTEGAMGSAVGIPYTYTVIAREYYYYHSSSDRLIYSNLGLPTLTADGRVLFTATRNLDGATVNGIFAGDGGPLTSVIDSSGGVFSQFASPKANASGTLAFIGTRASDLKKGVFKTDGVITTEIAFDPVALKNLGDPDINSSGTVTFQANDGTTAGIYRGDGGPLETIATNSGELGSFSRPSINDAGTVAFRNQLDSGVWATYTSDGTTLNQIYASDRGDFFNCGEPDINNAGTVAFLADAGGRIVKGDGGPLTTVVGQGSGYGILFAPGPAMNNLGNMAFLTDRGIATGPNPLTDMAFAPTQLFGYDVNALAFERAINDAGQIAFRVGLKTSYKTSESFIVLATPVPEPGTWLLLATAAGLLALCRPRSGKS